KPIRTKRTRPVAKSKARPKQRIAISHHREEDFKADGLRPYAKYRDLGIADASHGLARAHVIRLMGPCNPAEVSKLHFHDVDFQTPRVFGGFVGVDIFFVISGFLITGIIQKEMREGTFSFARFYERRVRRLLPALYVMIALTAIPALHYLLTSERLEFFRSATAAVTFTSNFFFWLQAGY